MLFSELGVKVVIEVLLLFELNLNKYHLLILYHHHKQVVLVSFINSSCNIRNNAVCLFEHHPKLVVVDAK
jgi:hypothetical protein